MRLSNNFIVLYVVLVLLQMIICNFFQFSPFITITLLPVLILCLPLSVSTISAMLIAFITGLAVDWLAEGIIGLNAAALIPVAASRKIIIQLLFGEDMIVRMSTFSIKRNGLLKVSFAALFALSIFLIFYITLDGAGTRPTWFNFVRFFSSLLINYPLALIIINTLNNPKERKDWIR